MDAAISGWLDIQRDGTEYAPAETKAYIERLADKCLTSGDVSNALYFFGRHERPWQLALWYVHGRVTTEQRNSVLLEVWQADDFPLCHLEREIWLRWFKEAGYLTDIELPRPSKPVRLYRAQAGRTMGLSWTPHRSHAVRFHKRNQSIGRKSQLLEREVKPGAVLAILQDGMLRNGQRAVEYIVDPKAVRQ